MSFRCHLVLWIYVSISVIFTRSGVSAHIPNALHITSHTTTIQKVARSLQTTEPHRYVNPVVTAKLILDGSYNLTSILYIHTTFPKLVVQLTDCRREQILITSVLPGSIVTVFKIFPLRNAPAPKTIYNTLQLAIERQHSAFVASILRPLSATTANLQLVNGLQVHEPRKAPLNEYDRKRVFNETTVTVADPLPTGTAEAMLGSRSGQELQLASNSSAFESVGLNGTTKPLASINLPAVQLLMGSILNTTESNNNDFFGLPTPVQDSTSQQSALSQNYVEGTHTSTVASWVSLIGTRDQMALSNATINVAPATPYYPNNATLLNNTITVPVAETVSNFTTSSPFMSNEFILSHEDAEDESPHSEKPILTESGKPIIRPTNTSQSQQPHDTTHFRQREKHSTRITTVLPNVSSTNRTQPAQSPLESSQQDTSNMKFESLVVGLTSILEDLEA